MTGYVPGEQPTDPRILKLNTNENPYPPSPRVAALLRDLSVETLRRYPDPVCRELREALAGQYGCGPEQVLVGNGSDEVLALAVRAFVERDAAVGFFEPSYSLYPVLCAIEDVETVAVPLADDFGWQEPAVAGCGLFFITNPNAPTGLVFDRGDVESFCARFPGIVIIDEAYVDFADASCMDLALTRDNVLVTRSLSKSYSLAGIRLGTVVGPERLIAALFKIKDSYNVNAISQAIAGAAVADRAYFRETVSRIRATRDAVTKALADRGFTVMPSQANFLWARPPGRPAADWFAELRERAVLIRHFPGDATGDWLRISIGTDEEMARFLAAVDEIAGA